MNPAVLMSYIIEAMVHSGSSLRVDVYDSVIREHLKFDMSYDKDLNTYSVEIRKEKYGC